MKNDIKIGDQVYFLYSHHLQSGIVKRINEKTITISYTIWGWDGRQGTDVERKKLVKKDRVAHCLDEFTVVYEWNIGVEGRYYMTYDEFPEHNAIGANWSQPYMYHTK